MIQKKQTLSSEPSAILWTRSGTHSDPSSATSRSMISSSMPGEICAVGAETGQKKKDGMAPHARQTLRNGSSSVKGTVMLQRSRSSEQHKGLA